MHRLGTLSACQFVALSLVATVALAAPATQPAAPVRTKAQVDKLIDDGFASEDVSVLMPDQRSTREFAHHKETKAPEGATAGATPAQLSSDAPKPWIITTAGPEPSSR